MEIICKNYTLINWIQSHFTQNWKLRVGVQIVADNMNMQNAMFNLIETLKNVNCLTIKRKVRCENIIYVHNKKINKN